MCCRFLAAFGSPKYRFPVTIKRKRFPVEDRKYRTHMCRQDGVLFTSSGASSFISMPREWRPPHLVLAVGAASVLKLQLVELLEQGHRMDTTHAVCKQCIVQHYWHQKNDQKCFFKVMTGDFRNRVDIPKKFATNVRGHITEEVKLEVPNGKTYYVKIAKEQNDLVFGSGWETFASAYDLACGDFLVFAYTEHSHFKVRIFDPSCCEKEVSCVLTDDTPRVQQRGDSQGNHMQSPKVARLAKHCIGSSSQHKKYSKTSPIESPLRKSSEDDPSSERIQESLNSGGFKKSTKCRFFLPAGYNMTIEQSTQVDALVSKIRPQIPLYATAIEKTTVAGGFLAMAKDYVLKYLLDKNGTITLSLPESSKTWAINLDIKTDGRYALSSGWLNFIHDNRLKEGDTCMFQPSKGNDNMTLIFHPLEQSCRPHPPGVPSTKSPRHGLTKPFIVARYTGLGKQQESEVIKKVRNINSDIPVYVVVMKNSNISDKLCMLHFGSDYARAYLPDGHQTMRLRRPSKDNTWKAELRFCDRRHYIGRGWRQFVADNRLKLGDICLFQLMKNRKKLTMSVHIIRKE